MQNKRYWGTFALLGKNITSSFALVAGLEHLNHQISNCPGKITEHVLNQTTANILT